MSSMRLLFVHNHPIWDPRAGGGQRVNHELATHAARAGHEVKVLHVGTEGEGTPRSLEYETEEIIESARLFVNALRVARSVRDLARRWNPDVVYASAAEGGLIPRTLPDGVGLMATMHHPDPPPLPALHWTSRPLHALGDLRRLQNAWLHASLLRGAHHVTVPSDWSRRALLERGYLEPDRPVAVVPNGVADEWFEAVAPPPDPAADLLFVGRLDEQKGVDVLLRALASKTMAGVSVRLVGTGPRERAYHRMAEDLGIADRVDFSGHRSHRRIRELVTRSRVFVLPSRRESYGMAILEAMAAGLPVVSTRAGGITEFARDGVNALLVRPDDPDDLASALRRLLDDDQLAGRLAAAGRDVARAHRWATVTERVLSELHLAAELARPIPRVARRPGSGLYWSWHARLQTRRAPAARPRPAPADARRIAVVRFGFLGDQLLVDPLLASLEEHFGEASFDLVVDESGHVPPWMAERTTLAVIPLAVRTDSGWARPGEAALERSLEDLAARWRADAPDLLVFATQLDGPVQSYLGARIASLAPEAWRCGLSVHQPDLPFLHRTAPAGPADWHEIDRLLSLAASVAAPSRFRLPRVPEGGGRGLEGPPGPKVVIHVGASRPQKRWMPERFGALIRELRDGEGARIVLVGTSEEAKIVPGLGITTDGVQVVDRTGETTLEALRDTLATADLFVGNDSFPMHLAVAMGRPTVVLVGPGAARYYGYPEDLVTVVREPVICSPRHGEECPLYTVCPHAACMQAVRVSTVVEACRHLLTTSRTVTGRPPPLGEGSSP